MRAVPGLGWLPSDPSRPFPAQYHRVTGVLVRTPLQTECSNLPGSWVQPTEGTRWEGEVREKPEHFSPSPPVSKAVAVSLALIGSFYPGSAPSPCPSVLAWRWLSAVVNFWTASLSSFDFLVFPSLVEMIPCIKVSLL